MQTANLMWQYFSIWLIVSALITGGLAVLAGIADWITGPRGRRGFGWHFGLTVLALLLGLLNALVHSRDGWTAVVPEGILLSLVVVILLYAGGFVGAHGSWDRYSPSGYKVAYVPFVNGRPAGMKQDVVTGFRDAEHGKSRGRPVGVAIDKFGALLIADDVGNRIWRVTPTTTPTPSKDGLPPPEVR